MRTRPVTIHSGTKFPLKDMCASTAKTNFTIAEHGTYNLDTKEIHAETVRSSSDPYFVNGEKFVNFSDGHSVVENGDFTTDDSSNPDFHFHAHKVRVYENDRVVFQNVTFYIGKVPVFWWPYLYQSLNDAFSFSISPAYLSSWGPSLLSQITFPITDQIKGRLRLDYRVRRGVAIGFDSEINYGADKNSYLNLRTYFIDDQNPGVESNFGAARTHWERPLPRKRGRPDEFHERHLWHRQHHQTKRCFRHGGLLPVRIPHQSRAGQRRGDN
jgi:hypothetical protein